MRTAAIIPARDEREGLDRTLRALPKERLTEIVVVDNGSRDGTAEVARKHGVTVVPEPKRGYGRACLAGIARLAESPERERPEVVVFLDADGSDDPAEIAALLAPLRRTFGDAAGADGNTGTHGSTDPDSTDPGSTAPRSAAGERTSGAAPPRSPAGARFDLVIGSRTRGEMEPGAHPFHARWGNRLATGLIRLLYGYRFTDLGPFRAIRWETLTALGMRDPDFGWTAEMQVKAARARVPAAEVPVSCRRRVGESKISGTFAGSLLAGIKILLTVLAPPARRPASPAAKAKPADTAAA